MPLSGELGQQAGIAAARGIDVAFREWAPVYLPAFNVRSARVCVRARALLGCMCRDVSVLGACMGICVYVRAWGCARVHVCKHCPLILRVRRHMIVEKMS